MVDQKYKYGFVVVKSNPSPGPEGPELSFPTNPAGYFHVHHLIVGDWKFVICGVAIYSKDFNTWRNADDDTNFFFLGPNGISARERLNNVWSKLVGNIYVEWKGVPGSSDFKRFGMFCGNSGGL